MHIGNIQKQIQGIPVQTLAKQLLSYKRLQLITINTQGAYEDVSKLRHTLCVIDYWYFIL